MYRRKVLKAGGSVIALGALAVDPVFASEHGGGAPENPPGRTNDRGNWIRGQSEDVTVTEVLERTSDPSADNFDEEFTFWRVSYDAQSYDTWVYREPARLGGGNFVSEFGDSVTSDRFWYGVSAPDGDGIQHEIVHDGQAIQYFDTGDGWTEITAQFDDGDLLHVNGVEPE